MNSHFCFFFSGASTTDRDSGPSRFLETFSSSIGADTAPGIGSCMVVEELVVDVGLRGTGPRVIIEEVEQAYFTRMHADLLESEVSIRLVFLDSIASSFMSPGDQNPCGY